MVFLTMAEDGMANGIKLGELREISRTLRRNAVPPMKVGDAAEARRMSEEDPSGHVWSVGEEYYRLEYSDGNPD